MTDKVKGREGRFHAVGIPALSLYWGVVSSLCTQYAASRLKYHPALGEPLFAHFYAPWSWLSWQAKYYTTAPMTFNYCYVGFLLGVGAGLAGYVLLHGQKNRRLRQHAESHGSAHFATRQEVEEAGLLPAPGEKGKGVFVGGWRGEDGNLYYLRHNGPEHIAAIAPTRSGKGISLVNPTLLSWPESVVVTDLKDELFNGTAGWRSRYANNIVHRFAPSETDSPSRFNPLEEVRLGTDKEVGDVQNLTNVIVDPSGKGMDRLGHFEKTAQQFLVGLILHVLYTVYQREGRCANLGDVSDAMSDPNRSMSELYEEMMKNTHLNGQVHMTVAKQGRAQADRPEEERGSVHSTAQSFFALYDDPVVRRNISESSFRVMDLMNADRPVTLYLCPPPEDKDRMKPLIRLVKSQILRVLLRPKIKMVNGKEVPPHKRRLLLMFDELPSFGKLEILQESLAYMAGYGIKAYLIMQDLAQLWDERAYGKNEQILSNSHIRVAFAPNKIETAEVLSKMSGTSTVVKEKTTLSGKRHAAVHQNVSVSIEEQQRPLMTPDEIMTLRGAKKTKEGRVIEPGEVLIFVAGISVIRGVQPVYFFDPMLAKRWGLPYEHPTWSPPKPIIQADDAEVPVGNAQLTVEEDGRVSVDQVAVEEFRVQ
ncbi:type IV secretory system conjugative DNA transfer family protein [uncultured Stenotrophomonas sp.]|uniref:type IV secretory system conjugative DNA transfer family protein n=1 Tax=uncultured Stenotrophomonas sp. TaxID=165438 RepID=UPI0025D901BB|nr:type IV secretory system conjugative DNA transfer family protein [uncultured Stenotrophomonas sp.]